MLVSGGTPNACQQPGHASALLSAPAPGDVLRILLRARRCQRPALQHLRQVTSYGYYPEQGAALTVCWTTARPTYPLRTACPPCRGRTRAPAVPSADVTLKYRPGGRRSMLDLCRTRMVSTEIPKSPRTRREAHPNTEEQGWEVGISEFGRSISLLRLIA